MNQGWAGLLVLILLVLVLWLGGTVFLAVTTNPKNGSLVKRLWKSLAWPKDFWDVL